MVAQTQPVGIFFDDSGDLEQLEQHIQHAVAQEYQSLFIISCDSNDWSVDQVNLILQGCPVPICGGIFPQLLYNHQSFEKGSLVIGLKSRVKTVTVPGLSDPRVNFENYLKPFAEAIPSNQTLIILVDGLSTRISNFLQACYGTFGSEYTYLGGGTGALDFTQKPRMYTNEGLLLNNAQVLAIPTVSEVFVSHGWEIMAGPFLITDARENRIITLDYQPAFELYRSVVEVASTEKFDEHNFFDIAKNFPFGLARVDREVVVRDPVYQEHNSLICVGEIPRNQLIYILQGDTKKLLNAAKQSLKKPIKTLQVQPPLIINDCISRLLRLGDAYPLQLQKIAAQLPNGFPSIGALTVGEIASDGQTCAELLNKTTVVGAFHQSDLKQEYYRGTE